MAVTPRPSTPMNQSSAPATPQTGTWIHPRFDEISRRQNARTFTDRNVKTIVVNGGGLFAMWLTDKFIRANLPHIYHALDSLQPYSTYLATLCRIVLIFNILVALLPLVRPKDNLSDIPLTPAQRKLLGLPPSETPPTPGSQYITPPRYPRSSTPLSSTPKSSYSNTPASGRASPQGTPSKGSPFSPNASPLLHKAIGGGLGGARRSSYGSPSPLGPSASLNNPSTPSPSTGKGASVSLNNKWLYERGRRNSGNARLFS